MVTIGTKIRWLPFIVVASLAFLPQLLLAQSSGKDVQVKWLTNPKGWAIANRFQISLAAPPAETMDQLSPCVRSAIITFNANGTYTEVFPKKDCPSQTIEDGKGTWKVYETPNIQPGITFIQLHDSKIDHYYRTLKVISFDATTLMTWSNVTHQSPNESIVVYQVTGAVVAK